MEQRDHENRPPRKPGPFETGHWTIALALIQLALACFGHDQRQDDKVDREILEKRKREGRGKPSMGNAPPARRWHQDKPRGWWFTPTDPEVDDLMCGQREGTTPDGGRSFRLSSGPVKFAADAWAILFSAGQGGHYLARRDLRGWARYVFLDDSVGRHPYNCRYVRMLRFVRGVRTTGSVS